MSRTVKIPRFYCSADIAASALCQGCWEKTQPCWVRDKDLLHSLQRHLVSHVCVSFFCPPSHVGSRECPGRCTWTGFSSQLWNPQLRKPQSFNNGLQGNLPDFSPQRDEIFIVLYTNVLPRSGRRHHFYLPRLCAVQKPFLKKKKRRSALLCKRCVEVRKTPAM